MKFTFDVIEKLFDGLLVNHYWRFYITTSKSLTPKRMSNLVQSNSVGFQLSFYIVLDPPFLLFHVLTI